MADRDIAAELDKARAANLQPCGDTISCDSSGMTDERGHPVAYVHAEPVRRHAAGIRAVAKLHRADPEGFIPMCRECEKASPCPTLRAIQAEESHA